jgi:hypothetical protein
LFRGPERHPDDLLLVLRPVRVGPQHALRRRVWPPGPFKLGQRAGLIWRVVIQTKCSSIAASSRTGRRRHGHRHQQAAASSRLSPTWPNPRLPRQPKAYTHTHPGLAISTPRGGNVRMGRPWRSLA